MTTPSKTDRTYILCPDPKCTNFHKPSHMPCERCDKGLKAIVCWNCGKIIVLSADHLQWARVDCSCGAENMQRIKLCWERINMDFEEPPDWFKSADRRDKR